MMKYIPPRSPYHCRYTFRSRATAGPPIHSRIDFCGVVALLFPSDWVRSPARRGSMFALRAYALSAMQMKCPSRRRVRGPCLPELWFPFLLLILEPAALVTVSRSNAF